MDRARKTTEANRRNAAARAFFSMLVSTVKRRNLFNVLTLDPAAWPVRPTFFQTEP